MNSLYREIFGWDLQFIYQNKSMMTLWKAGDNARIPSFA